MSTASSATTADSEVTFLANVTSAGLVAATSYGSWAYAGKTNPATYSSTRSEATKQGPLAPGTPGGAVSYYFDPSSSWTEAEKAGLASGLALWSSEVNIPFQQTLSASQAKLTFVRGAPGSGTFAAFPHQVPAVVGSSVEGAPGSGAYISFDTSQNGGLGAPFSSDGGDTYGALVRAEGRFLGLGNGGPYDGTVSSSTQQFGPYDQLLYTIMSAIEPEDTGAKYYASYPTDHGNRPSWKGNDPTTPMILDLQAAQRLYGVATTGELTKPQTFGYHTTLTGPVKNYFDFTVNTLPVVTIWDSAPGNTLDLSGDAGHEDVVRLTPGQFSSVAGLEFNLGIAPGTQINRAIGNG